MFITFDPKPINLNTAQTQVIPAVAAGMTTTPSITITPAPSAEELKTYCEELREWKTANNVVAGVILGMLSDKVQYIIDLEEPAKSMYDKLQAEIIKQSSSSSTNGTRIELVYKQFKDTLTMEGFKKH